MRKGRSNYFNCKETNWISNTFQVGGAATSKCVPSHIDVDNNTRRKRT
jgi:hypothetical protein